MRELVGCERLLWIIVREDASGPLSARTSDRWFVRSAKFHVLSIDRSRSSQAVGWAAYGSISWDEAFEKRDVEKMLSFFAKDAVWVSPVGTFKGKEELKRVLTWDTQIAPTLKSRSSGIGILVKGNRAVTEEVSEGAYEGKRWEVLSTTVFEFSDDQIQHIRLYYDRLSMIKQVTMQYTGVTGWFARRLVNYIVGQAEKGLR